MASSMQRALVFVVLLKLCLHVSTIGLYGYHRDELYFRMLSAHPAWGYVDQPPGTPMIARLGISVFGDSLTALRVPARAAVPPASVIRDLDRPRARRDERAADRDVHDHVVRPGRDRARRP